MREIQIIYYYLSLFFFIEFAYALHIIDAHIIFLGKEVYN